MIDLAWRIKYQVDPLFKATKGDWGSHIEAVQAGEAFEGDCKAYAMTCALMLIAEGAAPEKVRIAKCVTPDGPHLVCVCDVWVVDNLSNVIWAWDCLDYKWISSMKMSEPGVWRTAII
jgi:predicted transglutaminase-like cysteine proteinase